MNAVLHHEVRTPPAPTAGGPPLVLLHSIGTSSALWAPAADALADAGVATLTCDLRGHGATLVPEPVSTPARPWTLADVGGDVVAVLDRLGIERAPVAGVSLGGMVALWLGAHAPERVTHVAACCTGAHLTPASMWRERAALVRAEGTAALADAVIERWFTGAFRDERPEVVAGVRATLERTAPEGYAGAAEAIAGADLRTDVERITAPTLVLGGAEDVATPVDEHSRALAAAIPRAELHVLDEAAHLMPLERPRPTADLLRALLSRDA